MGTYEKAYIYFDTNSLECRHSGKSLYLSQFIVNPIYYEIEDLIRNMGLTGKVEICIPDIVCFELRFALPPANKDMRRVFAYLIKHRSIARDVVAHFAKAGLLYEDAEYHNAVFVGTDTDGVPRHAHKRSANSYGKAFRLNVEGSDPRYSFHHVGTDRSLYVFEAPIDMLSFITLYPENWQRHSYVACCGTSIQPVLQMLEQVPQLDTILLCLDNDEAGHQASRRMREQLEMRYSVERLIPENKDWNDDLTLSGENAQGFSMNEMR